MKTRILKRMAALFAVLAATSLITPAFADDHHRGPPPRRFERPHYHPHPVPRVYAPGYVYAPPPVYAAPPPVAPGLNIVIPLQFR